MTTPIFFSSERESRARDNWRRLIRAVIFQERENSTTPNGRPPSLRKTSENENHIRLGPPSTATDLYPPSGPSPIGSPIEAGPLMHCVSAMSATENTLLESKLKRR